ncbi:MAG: hypothetical protein K6A43_00845 [Treponema sp.]|nr:hypothetical protein [Treponema sp.]
MTSEALYQQLYNLYGPVTRARNSFLYTKKGVRITDLYQENGRAILGWRGDSAFTMLKNVLNRGQTGGFICEENDRLSKAVSELLDSPRKTYFFSDKMSAMKTGLLIAPESTNFYRPWSTSGINWSDVKCVIIEPPLPWTDSIYILAVSQEEATVPVSKLTVPFALKTGITRAIYNLIAALQNREEEDWFIYDTILTKYWKREGPYLYPKIAREDYDAFVLHCLANGILINPDYNSPSIVPFGADKGVFEKLKKSPFQPQKTQKTGGAE